MTLKLNINELRLDGYSKKQSELIRQSIAEKLDSLFNDESVLNSFNSSKNLSTLNLGVIDSSSQNSPDIIGQKIAHSVYRGLIK